MKRYRSPETDLNEDPVGLGDGLEEVIGDPADSHEGVPQLSRGHSVPELDHAPGEQCGGEGHGEVELDVVASVVVPAGEVGVVGVSVGEAGVGPPGEALVAGEEARALALEEEDGLGEGIGVVVGGGRGSSRAEDEEEDRKR